MPTQRHEGPIALFNHSVDDSRQTWIDPFNHLVDKATKARPSGAMKDPLDTLFSALADATRRAMVRDLLEGDKTVGALAAPHDMSLAAAAKHITILAQAGLVTQTRTGRTKWCRLETDALKPALLWIEGFGSLLEDEFNALETTLEALAELNTPP
ncbi:MAG: metalloregulator ArsR/SmtB family transcription factor [Pseudomonadota bacterium]